VLPIHQSPGDGRFYALAAGPDGGRRSDDATEDH
jgi:hypothetical protein